MVEQSEETKYKKIASLIEVWLELHKGETFDLDLICRQLEIVSREGRQIAAIKLWHEVKEGKLEKFNRIYRYIDNTIKYIDWINANETDIIDITWPHGHESSESIVEESFFGFDGHVVVSPGDIIVIAGVSNMGKTCFCLNLLWENMDKYPCTLMGNEYTAVKFKRRVKKMDWKNPLKEDGTPKFELIERREGWKDIIRPDNINIIDWIELGDNFYQIGSIIDGIQSKLHNGIAVISLQKAPGKTRGLGGTFSEHLASLYLSIDFEKLTVIKAKEWHKMNPNNRIYGFTIVDSGTKFHNIREIQKCNVCWGSGSKGGSECKQCAGTGYIDKKDK